MIWQSTKVAASLEAAAERRRNLPRRQVQGDAAAVGRSERGVEVPRGKGGLRFGRVPNYRDPDGVSEVAGPAVAFLAEVQASLAPIPNDAEPALRRPRQPLAVLRSPTKDSRHSRGCSTQGKTTMTQVSLRTSLSQHRAVTVIAASHKDRTFPGLAVKGLLGAAQLAPASTTGRKAGMRIPIGRWLAVAAMAAVLGGCQSPVRLQAIDVPAISAVQSDLKRQIAIHAAFARQPMTIAVRTTTGSEYVDIRQLPVPDGGPIWACGTGQVVFEIVSVAAELNTTLERGLGGHLGVTVPLQTVTVGGKFGTTRTVSNIQKLIYNVYPAESETSQINATRDLVNANPVAQVLTDLREALIASATRYDYSQYPPVKRPPTSCVTNYNPASLSDPGGTYSLALSIETDINGGVTVTLAVLEIGIDGSRKSTTGHSLLVTFRQTGLDPIREANAAAADACKEPNQTSLACLIKTAEADSERRRNELSATMTGRSLNFDLDQLRRALPESTRGSGAIVVLPMPLQPGNSQAPTRLPNRQPPRR